jgi:hypothetical protein
VHLRIARRYGVAIASCALLTASACRGAAESWEIEAGVRAGALTAQSSEADLRRAYGAAVRGARIEVGEGETVPGTVLFADDSVRRAEIIWRDTVARRRPARLVLRGRRSRWRVAPGISLGTSLHELERLNGRAFTLAGFGWDYGGVVIGWDGGALDAALPGVRVYLRPRPTASDSAAYDAAYAQVLGDREYTSASPAMQSLNPRVDQIFVDFD